jgi:hypothetical protein
MRSSFWQGVRVPMADFADFTNMRLVFRENKMNHQADVCQINRS